MKLKELIKKKGFWAAVAGAIVLLLQLFGIKADLPYVNEAVSGFCALLVALGLLSATDKERIDGELEEQEKKDRRDGGGDGE